MKSLLKNVKNKDDCDKDGHNNNTQEAFLKKLNDLADVGREIVRGEANIINRFSYLKYMEKCILYSYEERRKNTDYLKTLVISSQFCDYFVTMKSKKMYTKLNTLERMLKKLRIEKHRENDIVFNYGDISDKFYVILQGVVVKLKHVPEATIKAEKSAVKQLLELNKNQKTIVHLQLLELVSKNLEMIPEEILQAIEKFSSITDGIVTYKAKIIKDRWKNVNPVDIKSINIFDEKTGVQMYQYKNILTTGQDFGVHGLDLGKQRCSIAVSMADTTLTYLSRDDWREIILPVETKVLEKAKKFFTENVFKTDELGNAQEKIVKHFTKIRHKQGIHLFRQGDELNSLYVINKGQVKIYKYYNQNTNRFVEEEKNGQLSDYTIQKEVEICILGPGEFVGDFEIYANDVKGKPILRREFTAVCQSDCKFFEVPVEEVKNQIKLFYPAFEIYMKRQLADRYKSRNTYLDNYVSNFGEMKQGVQEKQILEVNQLTSPKVEMALNIFQGWANDQEKKALENPLSKWAIVDEETFFVEYNDQTFEFQAQIKSYTDKKHSSNKDLHNLTKNTFLKMVYLNDSLSPDEHIEIFRCYELDKLYKGTSISKLDRAVVLTNKENFMDFFSKQPGIKIKKTAHMQDINTIIINSKGMRIKFRRSRNKKIEEEFNLKTHCHSVENFYPKMDALKLLKNYNEDAILKGLLKRNQGSRVRSCSIKRQPTREYLFSLLRADDNKQLDKSLNEWNFCECINLINSNAANTWVPERIRKDYVNNFVTLKDDSENYLKNGLAAPNSEKRKNNSNVRRASEEKDRPLQEKITKPNESIDLNDDKNMTTSRRMSLNGIKIGTSQGEVKSLRTLFDETKGCERTYMNKKATEKPKNSNEKKPALKNFKEDFANLENLDVQTEKVHDMKDSLISKISHDFVNNNLSKNDSILKRNSTAKNDLIEKNKNSEQFHKTENSYKNIITSLNQNLHIEDANKNEAYENINPELMEGMKENVANKKLLDVMSKYGRNAVTRSYVAQLQFLKSQAMPDKYVDLEVLNDLREDFKQSKKLARTKKKEQFNDIKNKLSAQKSLTEKTKHLNEVVSTKSDPKKKMLSENNFSKEKNRELTSKTRLETMKDTGSLQQGVELIPVGFGQTEKKGLVSSNFRKFKKGFEMARNIKSSYGLGVETKFERECKKSSNLKRVESAFIYNNTFGFNHDLKSASNAEEVYQQDTFLDDPNSEFQKMRKKLETNPKPNDYKEQRDFKITSKLVNKRIYTQVPDQITSREKFIYNQPLGGGGIIVSPRQVANYKQPLNIFSSDTEGTGQEDYLASDRSNLSNNIYVSQYEDKKGCDRQKKTAKFFQKNSTNDKNHDRLASSQMHAAKVDSYAMIPTDVEESNQEWILHTAKSHETKNENAFQVSSNPEYKTYENKETQDFIKCDHNENNSELRKKEFLKKTHGRLVLGSTMSKINEMKKNSRTNLSSRLETQPDLKNNTAQRENFLSEHSKKHMDSRIYDSDGADGQIRMRKLSNSQLQQFLPDHENNKTLPNFKSDTVYGKNPLRTMAGRRGVPTKINAFTSRQHNRDMKNCNKLVK